jgi:superfamily I DNA/RNA helicase
VFLVNLGRGTSNLRAPIRVAATPDGEASVSVADYQSEADADAQAREREETKRLLYVAVTRARDRLYLSATAADGVCRMGRGSLGEVLPSSVKDLLGSTAVENGEWKATWSADDGSTHKFRVCGVSPAAV